MEPAPERIGVAEEEAVAVRAHLEVGICLDLGRKHVLVVVFPFTTLFTPHKRIHVAQRAHRRHRVARRRQEAQLGGQDSLAQRPKLVLVGGARQPVGPRATASLVVLVQAPLDVAAEHLDDGVPAGTRFQGSVRRADIALHDAKHKARGTACLEAGPLGRQLLEHRDLKRVQHHKLSPTCESPLDVDNGGCLPSQLHRARRSCSRGSCRCRRCHCGQAWGCPAARRRQPRHRRPELARGVRRGQRHAGTA
ncbi:hypothetical protein FA10DRAFT_52671 [Acaromyces ingoldii]|uniref:Uncharacterized protein n=1 Tax=Acaromyces ingoldii TaxID=215250 RepID=A0A316YEQ5_9BASI|nr:hypothetical protein FA10DRAFT_52671 [Acaromyces ingoldii]PWN86533.1 hypothetical protein FA10DRAFT_52671 [Acaromyces ingoldii]